MTPNTVDSTLVFMEVQADWEKPVLVWQKWKTDITTAWDSTEQRTARRHRARWEMAFQAETLDERDWPVRRAEMLAEFEGAVVIPIWPRPLGLASVVSDVAELQVDSLAHSPFKEGGYAYFEEEGLEPVFRLIEAVGENSITLASGLAAFPAITPPSYTVEALVYPCIFGMRNENKVEWRTPHLDETAELIHVAEL